MSKAVPSWLQIAPITAPLWASIAFSTLPSFETKRNLPGGRERYRKRENERGREGGREGEGRKAGRIEWLRKRETESTHHQCKLVQTSQTGLTASCPQPLWQGTSGCQWHKSPWAAVPAVRCPLTGNPILGSCGHHYTGGARFGNVEELTMCVCVCVWLPDRIELRSTGPSNTTDKVWIWRRWSRSITVGSWTENVIICKNAFIN